MAGMGASMTPSSGPAPKAGGSLVLAVVYVTALFFIWALVTNLLRVKTVFMRNWPTTY